MLLQHQKINNSGILRNAQNYYVQQKVCNMYDYTTSTKSQDKQQ